MNENMQAFLTNLAEVLGISPQGQIILTVAGGHPYGCRCAICLHYWFMLGPEYDGEGRPTWGPFDAREIEAYSSGEGVEEEGHDT